MNLFFASTIDLILFLSSLLPLAEAYIKQKKWNNIKGIKINEP